MFTASDIAATAMQRTLKAAIHCSGIGLHSGRNITLRLEPAPADSGILFRRSDLPAAHADIPARYDRVVDTRLSTVIANDSGASVATIEHLMSALAGCGIDNAVVSVDGPEVPVMDGSSAPFVFLIECAGIAEQTAPRRVLRMLKTVTVEHDGKRVSLQPADASRYAVEIDFDSRAIARQRYTFDLTQAGFKSRIARARTFGFLHEVEALRKAGLARGGSLENAVVIDGDRVVNPEGLRFTDEFVRHKLLDSIGDLYLSGHRILGQFTGYRCGHDLNNRMLHALFADPSAYALEPALADSADSGSWALPAAALQRPALQAAG